MDGQNNELITTNSSSGTGGFNPATILNESEITTAKAWLQTVIGQRSGISNIAEGMACIMRAKDYNIPLSAAVEHVHVIQGKTGADIHILKALLSRAGVTWKCIEDYTPQYEYTDGTNVYIQSQLPSYCVVCRSSDEAEKITEENKGNSIGVYPLRYYIHHNKDNSIAKFTEFELSDKVVVCNNIAQEMKVNNGGGYGVVRINPQPIDYVAKYEFYRTKIVYGEKVKSTAIGSYSFSEATAADMFTKDTYKKYPKVMIKARAWTYGARDIASDICMGLMETTELMQVLDKDVDESVIDYTNIE